MTSLKKTFISWFESFLGVFLEIYGYSQKTSTGAVQNLLYNENEIDPHLIRLLDKIKDKK